MIPVSVKHFMAAALAKLAEYFDVPAAEIIGQSREAKHVMPRHILMYVLRRELTNIVSVTELGLFFDGRDHSTVLNACAKISMIIKKPYSPRDMVIVEAVREIEKLVPGWLKQLSSDMSFKRPSKGNKMRATQQWHERLERVEIDLAEARDKLGLN